MSLLRNIIFFLVCATPLAATLLYGAVHQPTIAAFYLATTLLAVLFAADAFFRGVVTFSKSFLQLPLVLLGIYALVQVVPFGYVDGVPRTISVDPFSTEVTALHIFALVIFFTVALASIDTFQRLRRFAVVITVFGFLYAFYAILQSLLSPDAIYGIYKPQAGQPFGSFVNRHDFAAIIEMTIAIPLGLIFAGSLSRDKRLVCMVAIALMASAMLLSGSRGGLVALVAEIILLVILTSRAKGRKNLVLKAALSALLIGSAVGGAIFVGGDTSLTRFADAAGGENISSSRTVIWAATIELIGRHLPFGAGLGAYPQAYTAVDPTGGLGRVEQAHNDYLQIVADAGIIGLIIGGLFFFWFFREGLRNAYVSNTFRRGVAVGSFAGCFAILIHSLFDFVLHITAVSTMFLTLLAMLTASGRKYDDDVEDIQDRPARVRPSASITPIRRTF